MGLSSEADNYRELKKIAIKSFQPIDQRLKTWELGCKRAKGQAMICQICRTLKEMGIIFFAEDGSTRIYLWRH